MGGLVTCCFAVTVESIGRTIDQSLVCTMEPVLGTRLTKEHATNFNQRAPPGGGGTNKQMKQKKEALFFLFGREKCCGSRYVGLKEDIEIKMKIKTWAKRCLK